MPAPLDVDREAVKAHAITHGVRDAARAFNLPVSTVGSWSERDPEGSWCSPPPPKPLPPTVRPVANGANKPSVAARNSMERLSGRSRLNAAKTVDKGFRAAVKMPGERILVEAANLKALAGVGTTAFPDWQQSSTGPLVSIQLLSVEHSAQPSSNAVEHAPVLELPE